jgi:WXG100 family type VII secretion target
MADMTYEHNAIEQMVEELKAFVNQIDTHLSQTVEAEFNKLVQEGFTGIAATAFTEASAAWNALCQEYQAGLTNFSTAVSSTNQDMRATDQRLSSLFN